MRSIPVEVGIATVDTFTPYAFISTGIRPKKGRVSTYEEKTRSIAVITTSFGICR